MSEPLPCITIRPPWSAVIAEAEAIAALGSAPKLIENRGRRVPEKWIGQQVGIHAGLTWSPDGAADPRVRHAWFTFATGIQLREPHPKLRAIGDTRTGFVGDLQPGLWLATGAVVAVATLVDCHEAEQPFVPDATCCWPWGDRSYQGRPAFHLVLGDVRRLREPVPAKGSLLLPWVAREPLAEAVRAQIPTAVAR